MSIKGPHKYSKTCVLGLGLTYIWMVLTRKEFFNKKKKKPQILLFITEVKCRLGLCRHYIFATLIDKMS